MRIVAVVLALFVAGSAAGQGWQRDSFVELDLGHADVQSIDSTRFATGLKASSKTNSALEAGFERAAKIYSAAKLPEPSMGAQNGNFFGFFTGVFVGLKSGNDGYITQFPCKRSNKNNFIVLSWFDKSIPGNVRHALRNAAHELFHGVQWAGEWRWRSSTECSAPPGWILEGMADAAGILILQDTMGPPPSGTPATDGEHALRSYAVPLYYDRKSWTACESLYCDQIYMAALGNVDRFNYRTSSFWMFLSERILGRRNDPGNVEAFGQIIATEPAAKTKLLSEQGMEWFAWVAALVDSLAGPKPPGSSKQTSAFHFLWAEFLAEYGAWPLAKYKTVEPQRWLDIAFNKCQQVALNPTSLSYTVKYDATTSKDTIEPVSGRCLQVLLTDFEGEVKLNVEAQGLSIEELDQLQLGMSSWERVGADGNGRKDNCYDHAAPKRGKYKCLLFGKVSDWRGKTSVKRGTKYWRIKPERLAGEWFSQTFILSNVKPDTPSETQPLVGLEIDFSVDYTVDNTGKQGFHIPESAVPAVPDLSTPKRDLLYGIQSRGAYSSLFPVNMAPFGFETLTKFPVKKGAVRPDGEARVVPAFFGPKPNPGNEPRGISYDVLPLDEVAFGQLGALQGVVSRTDPSQPDRPAMSTLCAGADNTKPLEVLQSDRAALRVRVNTPICTSLTGDFTDCQNGCPVVETLDVTVSLAGGWRYFKETQPGDIITPSVRYDIDRFHHEVYGEPLRLAPLPDLNTVPPGGFPAPVQSAASAGTTSAAPPCDCSCQGFDAIQQLQKTPALMLLPGNMQKLQCMGTCMSQYAACN